MEKKVLTNAERAKKSFKQALAKMGIYCSNKEVSINPIEGDIKFSCRAVNGNDKPYEAAGNVIINPKSHVARVIITYLKTPGDGEKYPAKAYDVVGDQCIPVN